jgi:L-asparaginase II
MEPTILATASRAGLVEKTYYGDAVVTDGAGKLIASAGDSQRQAYMRSASKPLQALLVVLTGAANQFELSERELAICCASHCGSAEHVATVRSILGKLGLSDEDLECGWHWPGDVEERNRLIRAGEQPGTPHSNCSGKHCGMLASALAMGEPTRGYSRLEHPVQQATLKIIADMCVLPEGQIHIGIDGCGVPTFGMPLAPMARSYARLTMPEALDSELAAACHRICAAMAAAPVMVSGKGSFNSRLLEVAGHKVTCKGGAEGLFLLGIRDRDMGIAIKDAGGNLQPAATLAALRQLEVLSAEQIEQLADFVQPQLRNHREELVGQVEAQLELDFHGQ